MKKVTAMSVSMMEAASPSLIPCNGQKIHTVRNLNKPYGVALDPERGSLYATNFGNDNVLKCIM